MKIAIVHDWLTGMRGGEKVLEALCRLYPDAVLFTLFRIPGVLSPVIEAMPIRTSYLQRLPRMRRYYRMLLPVFPHAVESLDLHGFDLVISSSHCVAAGARADAGALHVAYVHTPMRYVWDLFDAYFGPGRSSPVARLGMRLLRGPLQRWDRRASTRVHAFAANSRNVADRVRRAYDRDAEVVYPPVDTEFFTPGPPAGAEGAYLVVSALVPYKNIELAIEACNRAKLPLRIAGTGPRLERLKSMAGATVAFLGWLNDEQLREEYRACKALIFPGEEDFGITAVEAQACGRPVIALNRGGVRESVVDGVTGVLFDDANPESLAFSIDKTAKTVFNVEDIRAQAARFSQVCFRDGFSSFMRKLFHDRPFH